MECFTNIVSKMVMINNAVNKKGSPRAAFFVSDNTVYLVITIRLVSF